MLAPLLVVLAACGDDPPDRLGAAADGAGVYADRCASCHGAALEGTTVGPPLTDGRYALPGFPDASIAAAITGGADERNWDFGPMPMVGGLSDREIAAVIAHVRSVQAAE